MGGGGGGRRSNAWERGTHTYIITALNQACGWLFESIGSRQKVAPLRRRRGGGGEQVAAFMLSKIEL